MIFRAPLWSRSPALTLARWGVGAPALPADLQRFRGLAPAVGLWPWACSNSAAAAARREEFDSSQFKIDLHVESHSIGTKLPRVHTWSKFAQHAGIGSRPLSTIREGRKFGVGRDRSSGGAGGETQIERRSVTLTRALRALDGSQRLAPCWIFD